jgi:glycosyltransferase involved in cell wall biosynthesis
VSGPVVVAGTLPAQAGFAPHGNPVRVLHFVTGGFSGGATQVAISLVRAALADGTSVQPLLVLRRKWGTDPARITQLREQGIPVVTVPRWPRMTTILRLAAICRSFRADVLVAHGYSEHLWGRYAGLLAGVKSLVQVEHNTRERYTRWRRAQSRWLALRTARIVGCSEGVRDALLNMGLPADRIVAIPNGIRLAPFAAVDAHPFAGRVPGIVMVARFSRQKDHATLLRAVALLRERGLTPPLMLAGGGKPAHRHAMEALAAELGLSGQVQFLGVCADVPALLMDHRIAVLSTHHEGMPLALLEGMAAGCAVVGSDVRGVREIIRDGIDGRLVPAADPVALAEVLEHLLSSSEQAALLAAAGRARALEQHGLDLMNQRYEALFRSLAGQAVTAQGCSARQERPG